MTDPTDLSTVYVLRFLYLSSATVKCRISDVRTGESWTVEEPDALRALLDLIVHTTPQRKGSNHA